LCFAFPFFADRSMVRDGRYHPEPSYTFDHYLAMNECGFSGTFGWVFNAMDFVNSPAPAGEPKIYTPNPLVDKAILRLALGATYAFGD
jgi:hypothetical protein